MIEIVVGLAVALSQSPVQRIPLTSKLVTYRTDHFWEYTVTTVTSGTGLRQKVERGGDRVFFDKSSKNGATMRADYFRHVKGYSPFELGSMKLAWTVYLKQDSVSGDLTYFGQTKQINQDYDAGLPVPAVILPGAWSKETVTKHGVSFDFNPGGASYKVVGVEWLRTPLGDVEAFKLIPATAPPGDDTLPVWFAPQIGNVIKSKYYLARSRDYTVEVTYELTGSNVLKKP